MLESLFQYSCRLENCNFIKKETQTQVFSSEFCETFKNIFSYGTPMGDCFCPSSLKIPNIYWPHGRSSRPEVLCKKGVLRNFVKFTGKHCARVLPSPKTLFCLVNQYLTLTIKESEQNFSIQCCSSAFMADCYQLATEMVLVGNKRIEYKLIFEENTILIN